MPLNGSLNTAVCKVFFGGGEQLTFGLVLKPMALDDAQAQLSGTPEAMASHRDHVSVRSFIWAPAASGALGAECHSARRSSYAVQAGNGQREA